MSRLCFDRFNVILIEKKMCAFLSKPREFQNYSKLLTSSVCLISSLFACWAQLIVSDIQTKLNRRQSK